MSEYVLNNACIAIPYSDLEQAQRHLAEMLRGVAAFEANGDDLPLLRLVRDPWLHPLVRDTADREYTIGEVAQLMYGTPYHDVAAFFDSLARAIPSDAGLDDLTIEAVLRIVPEGPASGLETTYDSVIAAGFDGLLCAVAHLTLISLLSSPLWRHDKMGFMVGGETFRFDHIANSLHGVAVSRRSAEVLRGDLAASSFWPLRARAFPHLRFGMDVEAQIRRFSSTLFSLMLKRLAELDHRADEWQASESSEFPSGPSKITPETPGTMKNYGGERRYRGYDGITRTFEEHIWIDRGNRIHLIRHRESKVLEIGYIGKHLSTMKYPT
jgi:hypothetical protein